MEFKDWIGPIDGTHENEVVLDEKQHAFGVRRGAHRQRVAFEASIQTKRAAEDRDDVQTHIFGALCEVAAFKSIGGYLYRNQAITGDDGHEIVTAELLRVEVKGSPWRNDGNMYLLVPSHGNVSRCDLLYLVGQIDQTSYFIKGFVTEKQYQERRQWLPWMPRPCWGVHENRLNGSYRRTE